MSGGANMASGWMAAALAQYQLSAAVPVQNLPFNPVSGRVQGVPSPEPIFANPRERIVHDILKGSPGRLHSEIARQIVATLDAMHLQEAFDLTGKLL